MPSLGASLLSSCQRGWCEGGFWNVSSAGSQRMFPLAAFLPCVFPYHCHVGTGTGQAPAPLPSAPPVQPGYRQPGGEAGRQAPHCYSAADMAVGFSHKATKWLHRDKLSQTCGCHNASKKGSQTRRGMGEGNLLPSLCGCTLVEVSKEPGHMQSP